MQECIYKTLLYLQLYSRSLEVKVYNTDEKFLKIIPQLLLKIEGFRCNLQRCAIEVYMLSVYSNSFIESLISTCPDRY